MSQPTQFTSLLEVINHCDESVSFLPSLANHTNSTISFPHPSSNLRAYSARVHSLYHFKVSGESATLGYMLPSIARLFASYPHWVLNVKSHPKTLTLTTNPDATSRSAAIATTLASLRERRTFAVLSNWRDELKPAYGASGVLLFSIERAAFPLLGIVGYGVMLLAYTRSEGKGRVSGIWVQRRSRSARTHAGYIDGTAAGGMPVATTPIATLLAEAEEEASLAKELVSARARACGTLSYFHTRKKEMGGEVGLLQPGVHFLYEMELLPDDDDDVRPRSNDGNVAGFELMTPEELRGEILAGRAKPWFALAAIDFFVRHGIITEGNERDYVEICMRLHRNLEFPVFGASFFDR
ncbi:thiamine pyrophosphokinase-related protein-like protein [Xylaria castorea]|nr:thiamine pyrophosphokinase-related protein-like protein [Xylaria castorea]